MGRRATAGTHERSRRTRVSPMLDIWGIILTALLSALIGAAGGSWQANKANAKKTEVDLLRGIIAELRTERDSDRLEIAVLTAKVADLKVELEVEQRKRREIEAAKDKRIDDLQAEVEELQKQVKELGGTPRKRKATGNLVP